MDIFVYLLFSMLVFFVPLSFAATEPWAFFVMQSGIYFILLYLMIRKHSFSLTFPAKIISCLFVFIIGFASIQFFNPRTVVQSISIIPFTVCPFYTLKEIVNLFTYFALFLVVTQLFEKSKEIKKLLFLIIISACVVVLIAICFPKGEYIKLFLNSGFLGDFGPFVNRNSAGIFLSMSFFVSLALTINNFYEYKKYLLENKKIDFIIKQSMNILINMLLFTGIILTHSRGAMLSTFISLFCFCVMSAFFLPNTFKLKMKFILTAGVLFLTASFYILRNADSINTYAERSFGDFSEQSREMLYKSAFDILEEFPLTGIGVSAFPVVVNKYLEKPLEAYPEHLHNDWLELLLGIGYPAGVVVFAGILFLAFSLILRIKFLKTRKKIYYISLLSAVFSLFLGSLVDFHLHIPANSFIFFAVLGLLSASSFYKDKIYNYSPVIYVKIFAVSACMLLLFVSAKNTIAWKYFVFGKNLSAKAKIAYYEKGHSFSDDPRNFEKLIIAYYNADSNKSFSDDEKKYYNHKANSMSKEFLIKYPFNRRMSEIYTNTKSDEI